MTAVVSPRYERIALEIAEAERRREKLIKELSLVESDLENSSSQIESDTRVHAIIQVV